jgi:uncharacterized protein YcbK (DUF882 family)
MTWSRRRVLSAAGAWAGTAAAGLLLGTAHSRETPVSRISPGAKGLSTSARHIALQNLHTDERMEIEYFRDGAYLPEALAAIDKQLRDFRSGERHVIDPHLMDYLVEVAHAIGVEPVFSVISGYRSPQTNASLREKSTGVAQHSLHMEGRAIDVRMRGVDCTKLASHAEDLKRGGVGYYRGSDFVHLDTGAFRTWKG